MNPAIIAIISAGSLAGIALAQPPSFPTFVDVPLSTGTVGAGWSGITVDRLGNRYVVESSRHWIRTISPTGEVTTFAGQANVRGSGDGNASDARFNASDDYDGYLAIAADDRGNIFVADRANHTIRRINPDGEVTTIAGRPGAPGSVDGIGGEARFANPSSIALDSAGNLYVADRGYHTIRKVTPDGVVSTLAGLAGARDSVDGTGSGARFSSPASIAVDRDGNVYVASFDDTVRKVSPTGQVTTLAGRAFQRGAADGTGQDARFHFSYVATFDYEGPIGLTVDRAANIWAADPGNQVVRKITPAGTVTSFGRTARMVRPTGIAADAAGSLHVVDSGMANRLLQAVAEPALIVHALPSSQTVARGGTAVFTVAASGEGLTYQWMKDGVPLAEATQSSLIVRAADSVDAGTYAWRIFDPAGPGAAGEVRLIVEASGNRGRLMAFSVRSNVGAATQALIFGATIAGGSLNETMPVLLRAAGVSLKRFGAGGYLDDPILTLQRGASVVASNDDWGGDLEITARTLAVGAFPLESLTSGDAAIATALTSGTYVMDIAGKGSAKGIALGEWFDATPGSQREASTQRLVNLSARKQLGANSEILTVGFTIGGHTANTLLVRAVGPSLAAFGVTGVLPDPMLQVFAGPTLLRENRDWGGEVAVLNVSSSVRAFALSSAESKDAALLITLKPGDYTLQVRSQNSDAGVVLAEIFEVP